MKPVKISTRTITALTICLLSLTVQAQFAGGNGTPASPYQISSPAQLDYLARVINTQNTDYGKKHYILTADIDLSGYGANFNNGKGWIPIGTTYTTPFNGIFDGNGKKITGLYINSDSDMLGLFGYLTGIVKNLGLEDVNITGRNDVGGLAGMLYSGIITNCYVTGNIKGVDQVGAFIGFICFSRMENCYTVGSVSGKLYVGGIAGSSTNGQLLSCAALNSSVEATSSMSVKRIAGFYAGSRTIFINIAFADMNIVAEGHLQSPITDPNILSDGESSTASEIASAGFFEKFFVFATPNDDPWTYETGKLPGFGKAVDMPDYLIQK